VGKKNKGGQAKSGRRAWGGGGIGRWGEEGEKGKGRVKWMSKGGMNVETKNGGWVAMGQWGKWGKRGVDRVGGGGGGEGD